MVPKLSIKSRRGCNFFLILFVYFFCYFLVRTLSLPCTIVIRRIQRLIMKVHAIIALLLINYHVDVNTGFMHECRLPENATAGHQSFIKFTMEYCAVSYPKSQATCYSNSKLETLKKGVKTYLENYGFGFHVKYFGKDMCVSYKETNITKSFIKGVIQNVTKCEHNCFTESKMIVVKYIYSCDLPTTPKCEISIEKIHFTIKNSVTYVVSNSYQYLTIIFLCIIYLLTSKDI